MTPAIEDEKNDLAVLVRYRTAAFILLYGVIGFFLVLLPRGMPVAAGVSLLVLLIGHVATGFRQIWRPQNVATLNILAWPRRNQLLLGFYGLLVGWMYISLAWSLLPQKAFPSLFIVVFLPITISIFVNEFRNLPYQTLVNTTLCASILLGILLILENTRLTALHLILDPTAWIYDLNRTAISHLLLTAPAILLMARAEKKPWALMALAFFLVGVVQITTQNQGSQLSLIIMAIAGFVLWNRPRLLQSLYLGLIALFIAFPFCLVLLENGMLALPESLQKAANMEHRLALWNAYFEPVLKHPIIGWGVEADRYFGTMGFDLPERFGRQATHPHNFSIEIWLNFGLIGIAIASACLWQMGHIIRRLPLLSKILATQMILASYIYMMVSTSMLQGWWIITNIVAAALLCTALKKEEDMKVGK